MIIFNQIFLKQDNDCDIIEDKEISGRKKVSKINTYFNI